MKKTLFALCGATMLALVSCESKQAQAEGKAEVLKDKIENTTNADSIRAYVEQARAYAQELISQGKDQEAQDFLGDIAEEVKKADPSAEDIFNKLKEEAAAAVEKVKDAADSVAEDAKEKATEAVTEKVEEAKANAAAAVETAKADAAAKVEEAKAKAQADVDAKTQEWRDKNDAKKQAFRDKYKK